MVVQSSVSSSDRLMMTVFVAVVFHVLLIMGISFEVSPSVTKNSSKSLEVTLISRASQKAPKKTEYLAQENQIGSGTNNVKAIPRPPKFSQVGQMQKPSQASQASAAKSKNKQRKLLTKENSAAAINTANDKPEDNPQAKITAESLSRQIAQMGAEFSMQNEQFAKQPNIKYIQSVNAHKYKAAAYEKAWQEKIERIGNLNFPQEARKRSLSGGLLLSVGVNKDGSIYSIKIRRSSGHQSLDEAAKRIVEMAAPFAPFPEGLEEEADVLVITRTWKFFNDSHIATSP